MNKDETQLTDKNKAFCREYVKKFEIGKSYSIAYNKKLGNSSYSAGCRLLKNVKIQEYLAKLKQEIVEEWDVKIEDIISGISGIAYSTAEKSNDRLKGYELLGKYKELFTDKVKHSGKLEPSDLSQEISKLREKENTDISK